ncbi:hypothetical protein AAVH_03195 [Aphelenchoides avenae]|nr:hypothetical protein AAVH_03195 [Aphelenchus avenae]
MVRPTSNVDVYRTGFADDPAAGRRSGHAAAAARNRQAAAMEDPVAPRPGVRDGIAVSAIVPMNRDKLIKDLTHRRQRRQNYWANQRYGQASVQGYGMARLFPRSTLLPPLQRGQNSTAAVTVLEGPLRQKHANRRDNVQRVVPGKAVRTWPYWGLGILIDLRPTLEEDQAVEEEEKCVATSNLLALGQHGVRGDLAMATVIMQHVRVHVHVCGLVSNRLPLKPMKQDHVPTKATITVNAMEMERRPKTVARRDAM